MPITLELLLEPKFKEGPLVKEWGLITFKNYQKEQWTKKVGRDGEDV